VSSDDRAVELPVEASDARARRELLPSIVDASLMRGIGIATALSSPVWLAVYVALRLD
jgi:hypothetical protein